MIDDAVLAFGAAHRDEFLDDERDGVGVGANGAGARTATERTHAALDELGLFARKVRNKRLFDGQEGIAALEHEARFGEVERDDGDVFSVDVLPNVEFRPVGEREDAQAFAGMDAGVENIPEFRALIARVPLAPLIAEGEDAFLSAGPFFIAARATDGGVETAVAQAIEEGGGFKAATAALGAPDERIGTFVERGAVGMDNEIETEFGGVAVAEVDHFLELVGSIDVQEGEGNGAGIEGFLGEAQEDGGIFADGIEQHGSLAFGDDFAHDVNAFRFELLEVTAGGH